MDNAAFNTISLCSGVAMLDEGLHAGLEYLGIRSRTVMFAEREAFAVSVLAARMEEGSLAPAPIWFGDFTELPTRRFRGVVDGVVAGFPCQDLSVAGRRAGLDGKRSGLFFNVLDIADDSGAWFLVLENVAGIASATASVVDEEEGELEERAAARVMGELADRGWNAEWITLSASDVGASHGRARWFCFAWRMGAVGHAGLDARHAEQRQQQEIATSRLGESSARSDGVADTRLQHGDLQQWRARAEHPGGGIAMDDAQRPQRWPQRVSGTGCIEGNDAGWTETNGGAGVANSILANAAVPRFGGREDAGADRNDAQQGPWGSESERSSAELADAGSARLPKRAGGGKNDGSFQPTGRTEPAGVYRALPIFAPGPSDTAWPGILARFPWLAPAIADEEAESLLCGMADGLAGGLDFSYRAPRLRCGGNGVVPLQAAVAITTLIARSGIGFKK